MVSNRNDIIMFLQSHKDEMAQRFGVVSVGLFGSYARGEERVGRVSAGGVKGADCGLFPVYGY